MKRLTLIAFLWALSCPLFAAIPSTERVELYAREALKDCPGRTIKATPLPGITPEGFATWEVVQTAMDQQCNARTFILISPVTEQTLVGDLFPIPSERRPLESRLEDLATRILKRPVMTRVERQILGDGLRSVVITKQTAEGPFSYHAWVDRGGRFLIVGSRGSLSTPYGKSILSGIGLTGAPMRGAKTARVDIVELSDLQCPTCKRAHDAIEPLIAKHAGRVSYTRLDLPLFENHDWSLYAALAGRAIWRIAPQHYWSFVDFIFENQPILKRESLDQIIRGFCEDHDIQWKKIEPLYRSSLEKQALLDQIGRAFDRGIFSTPTFFINGRQIAYGGDGAALLKALRDELEKRPARSK